MRNYSANGTKGQTDWNAVNWRQVNRRVRNLRQRIFRAQGMQDAQRPATAGVREHFAAHAIIVSSERLADCFCLTERLLISHFFPWYHACAFF